MGNEQNRKIRPPPASSIGAPMSVRIRRSEFPSPPPTAEPGYRCRPRRSRCSRRGRRRSCGSPPKWQKKVPLSTSSTFKVFHCFSAPFPPMRFVISSIRSKGKGGVETGFIAMDMSIIGLSSAAILLTTIFPHILHLWIIDHSPFLFTQTAIGSICPPQSEERSPGWSSTCILVRQFGQWFLVRSGIFC